MTVKIPIVTTYDGKGAKQAQKSLGGLDKSVRSLGRTLGVTLSAAAIIQFGKASAKAFLEDDKAAQQLSKTLSNLGLAFESPSVADFIAKMQMATGVADDELRPAFSKLVIATHDAVQAQEMLKLALDVSAGTGKDLLTVTDALQKAYLGNKTSLQKLGVGLTKAELASKDFYVIQQKLTANFGGDALANAKTYSGQLAILSRAADDAKETIGKGLIDALAMLGKNHSVDDVAKSMQNLATYTADVIRGTGILIEKLDKFGSRFGGIEAFVQAIPILGSYITMAARAGAETQKIGQLAVMQSQSQFVSLNKLREIEFANAQKLAKQRAAEAAKAKKVATDQLTLKKATAKFDLDRIQIEAALKGKISEEERLRLELQRAILEEDAAKAEKLRIELMLNEQRTKELSDLLANLPKADDPFADWPAIITKVNKLINELKLNVTAAQLLGAKGYTLDVSGTNIAKTPAMVTTPQATVIAAPPPEYYTQPTTLAQAATVADDINAILTDVNSIYSSLGIDTNPTTGQTTNVTVNVAGSVLAEQDLAQTIVEQLYVLQGNGTGIQYNARIAI